MKWKNCVKDVRAEKYKTFTTIIAETLFTPFWSFLKLKRSTGKCISLKISSEDGTAIAKSSMRLLKTGGHMVVIIPIYMF